MRPQNCICFHSFVIFNIQFYKDLVPLGEWLDHTLYIVMQVIYFCDFTSGSRDLYSYHCVIMYVCMYVKLALLPCFLKTKFFFYYL
jgi:hypothetical protein